MSCQELERNLWSGHGQTHADTHAQPYTPAQPTPWGPPELSTGYSPPQNLCSRLRVRFSRLPTLLARLALTRSRKRASAKSPSCEGPARLRPQPASNDVAGDQLQAQDNAARSGAIHAGLHAGCRVDRGDTCAGLQLRLFHVCMHHKCGGWHEAASGCQLRLHMPGCLFTPQSSCRAGPHRSSHLDDTCFTSTTLLWCDVQGRCCNLPRQRQSPA